MKILAIFLILGLAAAFLEASEEKVDEIVDEYILDVLKEMQQEPSVEHHVVLEDLQATDEKLNELTKLRLKFGKQLKETLNKILEKLKNAVEQGKNLEEDISDKMQEVWQHLKEKKGEVNEEVRELWEKITEKAKEYIKNHLEKISQTRKDVSNQINNALGDLNIRDVLLKIKEHLKNNVDPELLKENLEKYFAQSSELLRHFLELIKGKAKNKMLILIDGLLDDDDADRTRRGIAEYWEKIKNYFKDLKIDLQEKYLKFGEWVKEHYHKKVDASMDKMENIIALAKEFSKHAKGISKEVAVEAGEFFKQYKKGLGNLWEDIRERVQEIVSQKEE